MRKELLFLDLEGAFLKEYINSLKISSCVYFIRLISGDKTAIMKGVILR